MAEEQKIQANMIIEILGKPAEHIKKALEELIKKLSQEKGIKLIESKIHEPKLARDSKEIYTTFAEISLEFDSILHYFAIIFSYMPAHIEIISPEKFSLSNLDINDFGNRIILRLHDYDAIAKKMIYENGFLTRKLMEFAPHLFKKAEEKTENKEKLEEKIVQTNKEEIEKDKESNKKKKSKK